jgi:hypothetical protein
VGWTGATGWLISCVLSTACSRPEELGRLEGTLRQLGLLSDVARHLPAKPMGATIRATYTRPRSRSRTAAPPGLLLSEISRRQGPLNTGSEHGDQPLDSPWPMDDVDKPPA